MVQDYFDSLRNFTANWTAKGTGRPGESPEKKNGRSQAHYCQSTSNRLRQRALAQQPVRKRGHVRKRGQTPNSTDGL